MSNWEPQYSFSYEDLPDSPRLIATVIFLMMCDDFGFHLAHRFLHLKGIYSYIHKQHHNYRVSVGLAAEYAHPLEFLISAALPGSIGGMLLGKNLHFCTVLLWLVLRVFEALDGHCGY